MFCLALQLRTIAFADAVEAALSCHPDIFFAQVGPAKNVSQVCIVVVTEFCNGAQHATCVRKEMVMSGRSGQVVDLIFGD